MRHDIDMDIQRAVEMARLEAELGVRATYFVLISSDFYNVFSARNTAGLREITALGHSVGLHFDEMKYRNTPPRYLAMKIEQEIDLLETCVGPVTTVSLHRPSEATLSADYRIRGGMVANSYSTEFFKKFKYVSDSRRNWREDIYEIITSHTYDKLHILTHPIWYHADDRSMKDTMKEFVIRAKKERYDSLLDNIRDFKSVLLLEECQEEMGR